MQSIRNKTPIFNITPFTLLDYPDQIACIVWFAGCNMRCTYCYNPEIVMGKGKISYEKVLEFLESRKGILEGVVLSGGECTLHNQIIWLLKEIRKMGFLIKVDTNGSRPEMIRHLVALGLVDYFALDFKALPNKFEIITGSNLFENFEHSLRFLIASEQKFEVRTTIHSDLITPKDFEEMVGYLKLMKYAGTYYIQQFVNDVPTLGNLNASMHRLKSTDFAASDMKIVFR
ncbi:MAG: anaerobic ribonucleoside-triphosphate reductase activating protein [Lacibacter sp.]|nr:anaerobic ribonucleoside-triphosphate reductase activating protein [Lacibacter sp.]